MINVSTITKQIEDWIADDPSLEGVTVSRSEPINEDAGLARNGWIGIYRRFVDYDPRNLGKSPNNYEGDVEFDIVVQKTHLGSGAEAEDALEACIKLVLDRLVQVPRTYVDHFADLTVQYVYLESDKKTMFFQGAVISVTAEVSIEVK